MAIWVDAYIVENASGGFLEIFGDETQAEQYVELFAGKKVSELMKIRHTIVDIEDYDNADPYIPKKSTNYRSFP